MYIDKSTISNVTQTNVFLQELTCSICQGIIVNPFQCKTCETCFCDSCISGKKTCPKGCDVLELRQSKFMLKLLSKLIFKCKNNCDQLISYNDLETHYFKNCPKINFENELIYLEKKINTLNEDIDKISAETKTNLNKLNVNTYKINELGEEHYYVSKYHPHPLLQDDGKRVYYTCDVCRSASSSSDIIVTYYCKHCDFDYCSYCMRVEKLDEQIH